MPKPGNRPKSSPKGQKGPKDPAPPIGQGGATRFKPGQSGNPSGRPKSRYLRRALQEMYEEDPSKLRALVEALHNTAIHGEGLHGVSKHQAFAVLRDTLDGRPEQQLEVSAGDGSEQAQVNITLNRGPAWKPGDKGAEAKEET